MRRVGLVLVALSSAGLLRWSAPKERTLPVGTDIVRAGQAYRLLAFYLLERKSEDGLTQWSFYDNIVAARSDFPVVRITKSVTFRSHAVRN